MKALIGVLVLAAALANAQTCDGIAGFSGIYQITAFDQNLGGPAQESTSYRAHCVALADYTTLHAEPLSNGLLPLDKFLVGKLHCRYDAGVMQFAIMSDLSGGSTSLLSGKWYEGGWERCYEPVHRRCYHGLITLMPLIGGDANEWEGIYKCDDDDDSFTGLQRNKILLTRVSALEESKCRSASQAEECAIVRQDTSIRGQWDNGDALWNICVDAIDFSDFEFDYRSSSTSGVYQTGLVHFSDTDRQLLVDHRIASGCYRTCGGGPSGTSVTTLLSTELLMDIYDIVDVVGVHEVTKWSPTRNNPTECRALEPLDSNKDFSCASISEESSHTPFSPTSVFSGSSDSSDSSSSNAAMYLRSPVSSMLFAVAVAFV